MASFSSRYPVAVHVLPLHALKQVLARRALLAKTQIPVSQQRSTTRGVDAALGFTDVVHFYLSARPEDWPAFPILAAQLGRSRRPAFPHVALSMPTMSLTDDQCAISLWNIAVSRPQVPGVCKGGNWARGTAPARIAEVWRRFRATQPSLDSARGCWNGVGLVPTLHGRQIANNLSLLARAAGRRPELLLRAPVPLGGAIRLCVFSTEDAVCVDHMNPGLPVEVHAWPGYDARCPETTAWRDRIEAYFADQAPYPEELDFDRVRPRPTPSRAQPQARMDSEIGRRWVVKETLEAVFEDGVFRPVRRPGIPEGERVRLTVERVSKASVDEIVRLAARVYEGLSPKDIEDIEEMARRRTFFNDDSP